MGVRFSAKAYFFNLISLKHELVAASADPIKNAGTAPEETVPRPVVETDWRDVIKKQVAQPL